MFWDSLTTSSDGNVVVLDFGLANLAIMSSQILKTIIEKKRRFDSLTSVTNGSRVRLVLYSTSWAGVEQALDDVNTS